MTWILPPDSILPPPVRSTVLGDDLAQKLTAALAHLGAPARITQTTVGPSTVSFELVPEEGVRMRDFTRLGRPKDLAYALGSDGAVRIQAPIPGKSRVGIEVPSPARRVVGLSEVVDHARKPLTAALGLAPDLEPVTVDIAALPHLSVAGASGSGKSSLLHAILCSLLMRSSPDDLRLVLIDLKRTELGRYAGMPHLAMPSVTDAPGAMRALDKLVREVERRERLLEEAGAQDVDTYNEDGNGRPSLNRYPAAPRRPLPHILCVIDEFAELMLQSRPRVETAVVRLGQLGRACGVHLVLATQSPHREVFSGLIKANVPARIALRVSSGTHSRVALDQGGAEELLGRGDALLQDGSSVDLQRFQGAFVPAEIIARIGDHWRDQVPAPSTVPGPVGIPAPASRPPIPGEPRREPRRGSTRVRSAVLVAVLLLLVFLTVHALTPSSSALGCPGGTSYTPDPFSETCDRPDGTVACVLSSRGSSPTSSSTTPLGPWCRP